MIHESAPWKTQLGKDADLVSRWSSKRKVSERRSFIIEQKVFLSAYSMRKLLQAGKLSSSFEGHSIRCYAATLFKNKKIDRYNAHRFLKLYNLEKMLRQSISAPALLDLIIHSLLFNEVIAEDDTIFGFHVTSDHKRSTLWMVEIETFIKLMRRVSLDYPSQSHGVRNPETGESVEWKGYGPPPAHIRAKMDRIMQSNRKRTK